MIDAPRQRLPSRRPLPVQFSTEQLQITITRETTAPSFELPARFTQTGTTQVTVKLSTSRKSSDGSSVSDKTSFRSSVAPCDAELEPPYTESALFRPPTPSLALPSQAPPPFSSLYFPSSTSPNRLNASVTEPAPNSPPSFTPATTPDELTSIGPSTAEAETKAALPADNKGESSKSAEEAEPPPPYTEVSSPLDSFTYVMAAAGGAASIITQVRQAAPPPVNTLAGMPYAQNVGDGDASADSTYHLQVD
ncbi:MAG: hypothetical protein Q9217_000782 [Psora testacea]